MESNTEKPISREAEPPEKEPKLFPCFLCGDLLEVKMSYKDKPYFVCDPCGIQAFIRREKGIKRLDRLISEKSYDSPEIKLTANRTLNLVNQLEKLRAKLKEIEGNDGFFLNKDREEMKKIIRGEIRKTEKSLGKK